MSITIQKIVEKRGTNNLLKDAQQKMYSQSFIFFTFILMFIEGSGRLFNVREIVRNLYSEFNLSFDTYVCEDKLIVPSDRLIRAQVDWQYSYDDLMQDLIEDIKNCM